MDFIWGNILAIAGVLSIVLGLILNLLITTADWSENKLIGINVATLMITSMSTAIISIALTEKHLQDVLMKRIKEQYEPYFRGEFIR